MDASNAQDSGQPLLSSVGSAASGAVHTGGSVLSFMLSHWWILAIILCPTLIFPLISFIRSIMSTFKNLVGGGVFQTIGNTFNGLLSIMNNWGMMCVRCDGNPDNLQQPEAKEKPSFWDHIGCFFFKSAFIMSLLAWICPGVAGGIWAWSKTRYGTYDWVWHRKGPTQQNLDEIAKRREVPANQIAREITVRTQENVDTITKTLDRLKLDTKNEKVKAWIDEKAYWQSISSIEKASIKDDEAGAKEAYNTANEQRRIGVYEREKALSDEDQEKISKAQEDGALPKGPLDF